MSETAKCEFCSDEIPREPVRGYDLDFCSETCIGDFEAQVAREGGDWEPCSHDHDEDCYDQHCFNCGGCGCPGYCDDYQTYNLRPAETGGSDGPV